MLWPATTNCHSLVEGRVSSPPVRHSTPTLCFHRHSSFLPSKMLSQIAARLALAPMRAGCPSDSGRDARPTPRTSRPIMTNKPWPPNAAPIALGRLKLIIGVVIETGYILHGTFSWLADTMYPISIAGSPSFFAACSSIQVLDAPYQSVLGLLVVSEQACQG